MFGRSSSVRLFTVSGIRVGVDMSWFIVLFLMIYLLSGPFRATLHSSDGVAYLTTVVSVLALFASIIVHELGHACAARRQGVEVDRIDLYLFGGLTFMSREPVTPKEDFTISVAGPLATVGVILVCVGLGLGLVGGHRLTAAIELQSNIRITPALLALSWLIPVNVLLLIFNLLPAFPLDGGKIIRAAVWRLTGDKFRASVICARLGQVLAVLTAGFGLYLILYVHSWAGLYTVGLAWILHTSARAAIARATLDERVEGVRVADIMDSEPVTIDEALPSSQADEEYFRRYGWSWFPVLDGAGRLMGVVTASAVQTAVDIGEGWVRVGSLIASGGSAPGWVDVESPVTELLGSAALSGLGVALAVDGEGVLRGVVTLAQVQRALTAALRS